MINIPSEEKRIRKNLKIIQAKIYDEITWPKEQQPKPKKLINFEAVQSATAEIEKACNLIIERCKEEAGA